MAYISNNFTINSIENYFILYMRRKSAFFTFLKDSKYERYPIDYNTK